MNQSTKKTHYHLIVDKSGSMADCIDQTITGINEQMQHIKIIDQKNPDQEIRMGLTLFNIDIFHRFVAIPAADVRPISLLDYIPQGCTSLYDAVGSTIEMLEKKVNQAEDTTAVVIIITDGYENSSTRYSLAQINEKIARLEKTGRWTFSFIGATFDAASVAETMNIHRKNSFVFSKASMAEEVWDKLSQSMSRYIDKKKQGGDLGNLYEND